MALTRFPHEQYASLELNQVAFPTTGMVVSQVPLDAAFTAETPCENGMWVVADKAATTIKAPAAATDKPIGIVYTSEKEYDIMHYGLKTFGRKVGGDYPRVGILGVGDTVTTNCFQYDNSTYATMTALETALKAAEAGTTPMYVVPGVAATGVNKAVPALTTTKPGSGIYGKVVKYYTVPNGEKGIKYQIISL